MPLIRKRRNRVNIIRSGSGLSAGERMRQKIDQELASIGNMLREGRPQGNKGERGDTDVVTVPEGNVLEAQPDQKSRRMFAYKPNPNNLLYQLPIDQLMTACAFCGSMVGGIEDMALGECGDFMCLNCFLKGCPGCKRKENLANSYAPGDAATTAAGSRTSDLEEMNFLKYDQYGILGETVVMDNVDLGDKKVVQLELQFLIPMPSLLNRIELKIEAETDFI